MTFGEFTDIVNRSFGDLDERQTEQYRQLDALYRDWNSKINVISRKDIDELYSHHVLHSLAIAEYMKTVMPDTYRRLRYGPDGHEDGGISFLDIGTGGGFPGIPLAILFPYGKFTLCDSIGKKVKVASAIAESIGLDNTAAVNARAEALPGKYSFIVSRAVTSIENFLPWTSGKFSEGILYLKGGDLAEELGYAMRKFNLKPGSVHTWKVDSWLHDEYFEGKMVVFFEGKRKFSGK